MERRGDAHAARLDKPDQPQYPRDAQDAEEHGGQRQESLGIFHELLHQRDGHEEELEAAPVGRWR